MSINLAKSFSSISLSLIQDLSPLLLFEHNLGIMRSSNNALGRAFIGSVPILVLWANDKPNAYVYILHS